MSLYSEISLAKSLANSTLTSWIGPKGENYVKRGEVVLSRFPLGGRRYERTGGAFTLLFTSGRGERDRGIHPLHMTFPQREGTGPEGGGE